MAEFAPPYKSMRDTVNAFLQAQPSLHALGLPEEDSVFQADTVNSPDQKPFIVVRWGEQEVLMGDSASHPGDLWVYDDFGDYNRATAIAKEALRLLQDLILQIQTEDGRISQIRSRGIGADLADDGFEALVIPGRFVAVGNGS